MRRIAVSLAVAFSIASAATYAYLVTRPVSAQRTVAQHASAGEIVRATESN